MKISAVIFTSLFGLLSCTPYLGTKILHVVPYGFEGALVIRTITDPSSSYNKVNEDGFIEVAYENGYGILNQARPMLWSEEKVVWRKNSGALVDSVQFVNSGIRTQGLETVFLVVRQGKEIAEIKSDLMKFLDEEEVDFHWKPTGGKYPLGPRRAYTIKGNTRSWVDK
ncbi:hypothetical protein [Lewinella sp. LCG006]|uniref:hypothetical protein n=1 Tax=Lewinella sp. LCG006 TaxID=3231911 RepID=UPI00345FFA72